jgi:hypothetical protein
MKKYGLIAFVVLISGCAAQQVSNDSLASISQSLVKAQTQSQSLFTDINQHSRELSATYIAASTKPSFSEADLATPIAPDDIPRWDQAFTVLRNYVAGLQELKSAATSRDFADSAVALGTELSTGKTRTELSPEISTAVAELGQLLIDAKAENDLLKIMQKTDPKFHDVLEKMADAIGADNHSGLRGTVFSNWASALNGPMGNFLDAVDAKNVTARHDAVELYATMLDSRDAQLDALADLRRSLLLLADAHTQASKGDALGVQGTLLFISQELDNSQKLLDRFKAANNQKGSNP